MANKANKASAVHKGQSVLNVPNSRMLENDFGDATVDTQQLTTDKHKWHA
jgi:hypothetical protein